MRRLQSHAFSEKALKEQEPLITSYVDKLISRLHERAGSAETATLDLVRWYNYTTFDVRSYLTGPLATFSFDTNESTGHLTILPVCSAPTRKRVLTV